MMSFLPPPSHWGCFLEFDLYSSFTKLFQQRFMCSLLDVSFLFSQSRDCRFKGMTLCFWPVHCGVTESLVMICVFVEVCPSDPDANFLPNSHSDFLDLAVKWLLRFFVDYSYE